MMIDEFEVMVLFDANIPVAVILFTMTSEVLVTYISYEPVRSMRKSETCGLFVNVV